MASFFKAAAWLFFAIGGLAFWIGGRAISEFAGIGRIAAEAEGIGLAVLFGLLGAGARSIATHMDEDDRG